VQAENNAPAIEQIGTGAESAGTKDWAEILVRLSNHQEME
jgi:hypothetical protein